MNLSANHFRQEEGNLRGDARAHIGEKLASRRRQLKQGKEIREIKKPGLELPPICSFLRHSWDEAMRSIPFLIKQAPPSQKRKQINENELKFSKNFGKLKLNNFYIETIIFILKTHHNF